MKPKKESIRCMKTITGAYKNNKYSHHVKAAIQTRFNFLASQSPFTQWFDSMVLLKGPMFEVKTNLMFLMHIKGIIEHYSLNNVFCHKLFHNPNNFAVNICAN